jgi:diacylglycerol kinase family enzyme
MSKSIPKPRPRIALLSNVAQLPRIREYCADNPDVFHYEVEDARQVGQAMKSIALVRPKLLAINGGDGIVQAALSELSNGGHFGREPPPVTILPNGETIAALERLIGIARNEPMQKRRWPLAAVSLWRRLLNSAAARWSAQARRRPPTPARQP